MRDEKCLLIDDRVCATFAFCFLPLAFDEARPSVGSAIDLKGSALMMSGRACPSAPDFFFFSYLVVIILCFCIRATWHSSLVTLVLCYSSMLSGYRGKGGPDTCIWRSSWSTVTRSWSNSFCSALLFAMSHCRISFCRSSQ